MNTAERGNREPGTAGREKVLKPMLGVFSLVFALFFFASGAAAQDDVVKLVESKRVELKEREEALTRDEARLNALKKEVDEKIAVYTQLIARMEAVLKKVEEAKNEKIDNIVKAYEIMTAEDAAARLAVLDKDTALAIMTRMKSKKAGAIIAAMDPGKAAALTRRMAAVSRRDR